MDHGAGLERARLRQEQWSAIRLARRTDTARYGVIRLRGRQSQSRSVPMPAEWALSVRTGCTIRRHLSSSCKSGAQCCWARCAASDLIYTYKHIRIDSVNDTVESGSLCWPGEEWAEKGTANRATHADKCELLLLLEDNATIPRAARSEGRRRCLELSDDGDVNSGPMREDAAEQVTQSRDRKPPIVLIYLMI